eukprot:TRINITY_DN63228_c0_g1_i1.p1 TRINITY_DN63228_c0_g1~~TRINITY_DN63228_c0_g1_i1.p1  ORF type:complete len:335 (+),score=55.75 TRINITY_DN63228_c0_g1_i1:148-1152(+)
MELHKLRESGGILVPYTSVGRGSRKAVALGKACGQASFSLDVSFLEGEWAACTIGIVSSDTSLETLMDVDSLPACRELAWYRLSLGSSGRLAAFDGLCDFSELDLVSASNIRMDFLSGTAPKLLYYVNDGPAVDVTNYLPKSLRPGEYKPCISIANPSLRVRCRISWRNAKRRLQGSAFVSRAIRGVWERRRYTDVVVRTADGHQIPCHRAHLAEGSPVFAAEFERWARDARELDVAGDRVAVEPMLEFFYTGQMAASADGAAVLPLAHRYQVDDLVSLAAERVLESLDARTVVAAARALRPLREDDSLCGAWRELCARASSSADVVEALALAA